MTVYPIPYMSNVSLLSIYWMDMGFRSSTVYHMVASVGRYHMAA